MRQVISPPPVIPSPRPSNPSALELAIHRFEEQAKAYHHQKGTLAKATGQPEEMAKARAKLDRDWQHLQRERIRISTQAELQKSLEGYRADAQLKSEEQLLAEPHHPTRLLARHLAAVGEPKPSLDHSAHHIILGRGRWRARLITRIRLSLHLHGIGINDPVNGVWLPRTKADRGHWATPFSPAHTEIHRFNYETWLITQFQAAGLNAQQFGNRLRHVKGKLKHGGYPAQIVSPKDDQWSGA